MRLYFYTPKNITKFLFYLYNDLKKFQGHSTGNDHEKDVYFNENINSVRLNIIDFKSFKIIKSCL